ncbi:cyclic beta 1-2 glucan synthetase [Sediminibacterium sp. WSJ-3]|nr:cyclic beta 1-2 glucan synthetase [Sediminibacterium soli]
MLPKAISVLKKNIIRPFISSSLAEKYRDERPPLRADLFSEAQIESYAKKLARSHVLISEQPSEQLLKRLAENEDALLEVHALLTESVKTNHRIVPAGEWLLDNFYLIEEQIYTGKKHLPKGYSKGLPQLLKGASAGLPRVYDIAVEIISHSDGRVDLSSLTGFVNAYQSVTYLKLGELWAIPIMLRLALIENLRRLAVQVAIDITYKNLASYWGDEMIRTAEEDPKSLILVIADMARSKPPMVSAFVAELTRKLNGKGSALSLPLNWIEQTLAESGSTSSELVNIENQKQAADQISISNSISSLRFLSSTDWREFVESTSVVEKILSEDVGGIYREMDFHTRDQYRHAVEKIAKCSSEKSEKDIAAYAIAISKHSHATDKDDALKWHVGYYLVDKGVREVERFASMKLGFREHVRRQFNRTPLLGYTGAVLLFTLLFGWPLWNRVYDGGTLAWTQAGLLLVILLGTSQLALTITNWLSTLLVKPFLLQRMDYSKGIPGEYASMVVIPTMLNSMQDVDKLAEGLEVRFLANRDANLLFALLTDFKDAAQESMPGDDALLLAARDRMVELNRKYGRKTNDTFFLFHRPRKWNPQENTWMGFERKRGKLGELNALLRGRGSQYFSLVVGEESVFRRTRYVITLDTDTQLPRDAAWKMVGTLAHPLNHAVYAEKKQRVVQGYTILQPRVSNSLPVDGSSLYARIHGNEPGTDPYTRAISDVYQDLFREGSFIGKGIYDVDAFELALANRFPDNRILSHDLLEGCYARSGLVSDIQLYEEYPSSYQAEARRRHRWIRGDWQIAQWIMPWVRGYDRRLHRNPVSALSVWKIFDNLRRTFVPMALFVLLMYGWLLSAEPWFWTTAVVLIKILPAVVVFCWDLVRKPKDVLFVPHAMYAWRAAISNFAQYLLELIFLAYETVMNTDAVIRTGWRIFVSKRKLLEWNPFSNQRDDETVGRAYLSMWFVPALATAIFVYVTINHPMRLFSAMPVLILWFLAPFFSWWVSLPMSKPKAVLGTQDKMFLHLLSRKIWHFFETFVGEEDSWLPPDNYQEQPAERIAHRTSPTNIGLSLLSNLTAYDFKYITATQFLERTTNTLGTMQSMEKYRGHLYNWYDTQTLKPLHPRYISTVDSGNLVGHLLTLKQALLSLQHDKIVSTHVLEGLRDTAAVLNEHANDHAETKVFFNQMQRICAAPPRGLFAFKFLLDKVEADARNMVLRLQPPPDSVVDEWSKKLLQQCKQVLQEMVAYLPWLLVPVPEKFANAFSLVAEMPGFLELARIEQYLLPNINSYYSDTNTKEENEWLDQFRILIVQGSQRAKEFLLMTERLAQECLDLGDIDYDFLYDRTQHLLAIGYNIEDHKRDHSFYDLLASEARLTTFTAIAQGKLPQESWFALGRQLTSSGTTPLLLSWSGSMFEYLMPFLVMPSYENTLLDETGKAIIQKQIEYGRRRGVPWGISESGYNLVDANLNYQYRAFGVPGTGFKRGLGEDLVIAPYASVMGLLVDAEKATGNMRVMQEEGFMGEYGFYEAIDYTPARLPRRQSSAIVRSFMAHHQGMSFLSIAFALLDKPMQKRFEAETQFKATLLLLQERVPRITTFYSPGVHVSDTSALPGIETPMRVINTPNTEVPEVQLLSNGRYNLMITNSGGGYSRWKDISVTRWREDGTADNWGSFCYIRDLETNAVWSTAYQPTLQTAENYEAVFSQGRAEFRRRDHGLETHTEIVVSPEDDVELRRIHITNRSRKKRFIEITSYGEVVLTTPAADSAHPAFSNLFVQTELIPSRNTILCTRRPRSADAQMPYMFHLMKVHEADVNHISYETDRSRFIGRGNTIHNPQVLQQRDPLSNTEGFVLDPVMAIQYRISIEPQASATIDLVYGIGETKEACNWLVEKYQDRHMANRALELAWTHSQVILRQIDASESDAQMYGRLASSIIFVNPSLRTDPSIMLKNQRGQSGLWGYAISGDLPIVLLQIEDPANIELAKQLIQAHAYWRLKGLLVDLVIWNEDHGGYRQTLQNQLLGIVAPGVSGNLTDQPGGIFIRSADQISSEDRILFQSVARVVISDRLGTLEEQMNRRSKLKGTIPYFSPSKFYATVETSVETPKDLVFFNGMGGFAADGKEYVIATTPKKRTPAPWINVIANPHFGAVVSESGQSYTWIENAHELRLTPWHNDPVSDTAGEAFYLRDEESGRFWSPTPLPNRGKSPYITRHGFGYSSFAYSEDGIHSELTVFVDLEDAVKFIVIRIHNASGRQRRLSATGYMEWVLGDLRYKNQMHVVTETDPVTGALFAHNAYNKEFENRVAFFDVDEANRVFTTDRGEFIGRNGTLQNPNGMNRAKLSGKTGAGLDPCAAIQVTFDITEEEEKEIIFHLGCGRDQVDATELVKKYRDPYSAAASLEKVKAYWNKTLSAVQIQTPDTALNILSNGWLNYQALACRIWARSGFYQSGGAFGFRDQLQDTLSLMHNHPSIVREQLLLCASRQFREGDVQHWWHPPVGRGVRTTCSDDFLWLPFVTARYVQVTGDTSILDIKVHFLEGRALNTGEESYYDLPIRSDESVTLYEHCVRSIEHGLRFGEHGLPLMGSGDWNDGMDKVGEHGRGESVWLAFFLYNILEQFVPLAEWKKDTPLLERIRSAAPELKGNINLHAWDGEWYRRAYFDDGTPLGSLQNDECRIDSIAQSWSVLSGAGESPKAQLAMSSADRFLVNKEAGIIQLFDPPFDKSALNPGYIKGYVPGVRENGGQYTHAAIWLVMAFAAMGNTRKTWELIQLINPVNHGLDEESVKEYKVEPYVMAADVYGVPLHKGRGGWTWYTGSAGWMYQLILESFIGLQKTGDALLFSPSVPEEWEQFTVAYRFIDTVYQITCRKIPLNGIQQPGLKLDGEEMANGRLPLSNDGKTHSVEVLYHTKKEQVPEEEPSFTEMNK